MNTARRWVAGFTIAALPAIAMAEAPTSFAQDDPDGGPCAWAPS